MRRSLQCEGPCISAMRSLSAQQYVFAVRTAACLALPRSRALSCKVLPASLVLPSLYFFKRKCRRVVSG